MSCSKCAEKYCGICLMRSHKGKCEEVQLVFLEKTLNFRRCGGCKMFIEKTEGCRHVKCRCGFEFCF